MKRIWDCEMITMKVERISTSIAKHYLDTNNEGQTLVVDCRPFLVHTTERIQGAVNFFCPTILKRRLSAKGFHNFETALTSDVRRKLRHGDFRRVILYDNADRDMTSDKHTSNCDMSIFIKGLSNNSFSVKSICILKGGFKRFKSDYPSMCVSTKLCADVTSGSTDGSLAREGPTYVFKKTEPTELLPYLFIGDETHPLNNELMYRLQISAILNVSTSCSDTAPPGVRYKVIPIRDNSVENISAWFAEAIKFIESACQSGGRVLVHCRAGISRSATICIAYLMFRCNLTLDEAFEYIKARRAVISPNMNFMQQLTEFEKIHIVRMRELLHPGAQKMPQILCGAKHQEKSPGLNSGFFGVNPCAIPQSIG